MNINNMNRYTIALPTENEFEFLASVLTTWDNSDAGILHKRHALDQLLIRSEIDGYVKSRVDGNRDLLKWQKQGSDLTVFITRVKDGLYDVEVRANSINVKALNIEEL